MPLQAAKKEEERRREALRKMNHSRAEQEEQERQEYYKVGWPRGLGWPQGLGKRGARLLAGRHTLFRCSLLQQCGSKGSMAAAAATLTDACRGSRSRRRLSWPSGARSWRSCGA